MHFFAFSRAKKVEPIMKVQITFQLMAVKNKLWREMQIYGFFAHVLNFHWAFSKHFRSVTEVPWTKHWDWAGSRNHGIKGRRKEGNDVLDEKSRKLVIKNCILGGKCLKTFKSHCSWRPQIDGWKSAENSCMDFYFQLVTLEG